MTFVNDKWATICTIKFEDRPFHVAMAMAQIKGVKKTTFLEKEFFLDSDFRNGISNNYN